MAFSLLYGWVIEDTGAGITLALTQLLSDALPWRKAGLLKSSR